jgi:hypothetical protein
MKLTGSANARIEHENIDDIQSAGKQVEEEHYDSLYESDERLAVLISTIDKFQGEEADIVVLSLVRNNDKGSIGFMKEPERANVMPFRARCGLIMLGSKRCLENCESVKGRILWTKFFQLVQCDGRAALPGLPVKCKHHLETKRFLGNAEDFERAVDGSCDLLCVVILKYGHMCPSKCHPGDEHTSVLCAVQHKLNCPQSHIFVHLCGNGPKPCKMCAEYESTLRQPERRKFKMRLTQYLLSCDCSNDSRKYEMRHEKL